MPRSTKRPGQSAPKEEKSKAPAKPPVSPAKLRELRKEAKVVRQQVALDREQIKAESRQVVEEAATAGKLTKLTLLLRADEQHVLEALDQYATEHGLRSRNQVLRAALSQLLGVDLDQPHWGWPAGRPRQ